MLAMRSIDPEQIVHQQAATVGAALAAINAARSRLGPAPAKAGVAPTEKTFRLDLLLFKGRFNKLVVSIAACIVLLGGCATSPPSHKDYIKPRPLPVVPQSPPPPANGSVFAPVAHVSLFQDHRLWRAGDLVTIDIVQNATASTDDNSQLQRQSSTDDSVGAFLGVPLTFGHHAGQQFSPSFSTSGKSNFQGKGQTSASNSVQAQVAAAVVKIEANGVLALQGRTDINVNGNIRTIDITGYARPEDIGPDNTIPSTDLANMNVQYVGVGPTQSAHHVPWLQNVLNKYWPF
jgi:flagellar L-ring protein precursor FlgH